MLIALIGYGEVGRILAEDLRARDHIVRAYDIALSSKPGDAMRAHARSCGVVLAESHADAVRQCELVVSAVTASQTLPAARACADALPSKCFFLDLNSASPSEKISAAAVVTSGSGRYVEGAVMTSVPPHRSKVPLLLGGSHAASLEPVLRGLGFAPKIASAKLGVASATKMCRSVIIKGMEAMVVESFTSARRYGVEDALVASLTETFPEIDWEKQAAYFFQRAIEHGRRRSEELREAALTVKDIGLEPWSATATAERQAWVAELAERKVFGERGKKRFARSPDWRTEADRILSDLGAAKER